jgi:hypothetical protein
VRRNVRASWRRPQTAAPAQEPADRAGTHSVTQPGEFTLDATVSPSRILLRHKKNQGTDLLGDRRASCPVWVRPFPPDQTPVPGQQRGWRDDPMPPQRVRQHPGEGGQDRPVGPGGTRSDDLAAQYGDLMA